MFLTFTIALSSTLYAGDGREESALGGSRRCVKVTRTAETVLNSDAASSRRDVIRALDRLRDKVEEWGVVTISAPVAVIDDTAFYVPDNIVPPEQLYEDARVEVGALAAQATETGVNNQLNTVLTPVPLVPRPPAGGTATTSTTSTVTAPPPREIIGADGKPIASLNAEGLSNAERGTAASFGFAAITPPGGLLTGMPAPTKSVSAALREAEDNTMRQKIYSQLSFPKEQAGYTRIIFAVVQVSCNPGWRTQEHYIADVSASLEFYDACAKEHLSRGEQRAPTVFSVLPLVDAQTVEMANSQREVTQLAFQLAASLPARGVDIKAKDLFQFVRRYSRDLRSRTPIPVVNSYSSGGTFGFRFSPSFQAMRDPAQKKARAANVLLPTTFPALVTVVVYEDDLKYVRRAYGVKEPAIMTHVSTRWFLKDRLPLTNFAKRLFTPMRRDTAAIEINAARDVAIVEEAKYTFKKETGDSSDGVFNPQYEEMRRQILALSEKGLGRSWPILLRTQTWEQRVQTRAEQKKRNDDMRGMEDKARKEREDRAIKLKAAQLPVPLFRSTKIPTITAPIPGTVSDEAPLPKESNDQGALGTAPAEGLALFPEELAAPDRTAHEPLQNATETVSTIAAVELPLPEK